MENEPITMLSQNELATQRLDPTRPYLSEADLLRESRQERVRSWMQAQLEQERARASIMFAAGHFLELALGRRTAGVNQRPRA